MPPLRRPDLVTRIVGEEVVILDRAGGHVHRLNATASWVWQECDGTRTLPDIASRLAGRFERPPDEALGDVRRLVADLEALGLLAAPRQP